MKFVFGALLFLLWSPVVALAQWDSTAVEFAKSLQRLNPDKFETWEDVYSLPRNKPAQKSNKPEDYYEIAFDLPYFQHHAKIPDFNSWQLGVSIDCRFDESLCERFIDSINVHASKRHYMLSINNAHRLPRNIGKLKYTLTSLEFRGVDTVDACLIDTNDIVIFSANYMDSAAFCCLPNMVNSSVLKSNYYEIPNCLQSRGLGMSPVIPAPRSRIIRAWVPQKGVRLMFDANLIDVVEHSVYETMRFFPVDYQTYNDYAYGLPAKAAYKPKAKERRWDGRVLRQKQIVNIRTIEQYKKEYKWSQKASWKRRLRYRLLVFCSYF